MPNRLITEKSPYLLQHAHNPVDWFPWGPEAFEKAAKEDKPVFLSVGYSTCHWCHVMEKESFEDVEVARLMNEAFVTIKVDREERPDIDNLYMTVCGMMTGSGGWPLTIIMTPQKRPFFAGTYFPRDSAFGRIGMIELVPRIKEFWTKEKKKLLAAADEIIHSIEKDALDYPEMEPEDEIFNRTFHVLKDTYDKELGGFGDAPKFPTAHKITFLINYWKKTGNKEALDMAENTLRFMRSGGIYDHIGFGFHRYSTDRMWLVPHFEKMLYDQALLSIAYTDAYEATGNKLYQQTVFEILEYVLRDMTDTEGGFYSGEDADSEGIEGKFYIWSKNEITDILGEDAEIFIKTFGVRQEGNFMDHTYGKAEGNNILFLSGPALEDMFNADAGIVIDKCRRKLFAARSKRTHPGKDDKILADWNGLMIAAFAQAGRVFRSDKFTEAAKKATGFILEKMLRHDGRLLHRYRDGDAAFQGSADDYSFMIQGLLKIYEESSDSSYLDKALQLNKVMASHFWDSNRGGFFFTADDDLDLPIRRKEAHDSAIPSGNSVAMMNLLRLSRITADEELKKMALMMWKVFFSRITEQPSAYTAMITAGMEVTWKQEN